MAEMLVQNFDNWLEKLDQTGIDVYKERAAQEYLDYRNTKISMTSAEITNVLRRLSLTNREKWTAKHETVKNMSIQEIEAEQEKARERFQVKYNIRSKKGDIVEIQEDGFWTDRGWDKAHYDLLVVPGLKEAKAEYGGSTETAKFKANIIMSIDVDQKQQLTISDFEAQVLING